MSDTPRTDVAYMEINRKLQGQWCSHSPTEQTAWDIARQLERELAEARRDASAYRNVLWGNGFVMCDIPACNCGSWHYRYGLPERMDEIREALRDADVLDNSTGNLPLNAIKKLVAQRDEARRDAERYRWLRDEAIHFVCHDGTDSPWVVLGKSAYECAPTCGGELDAAIDAAMKVE